MEFKKYQHIERLGTTEVNGITVGECCVFPKIDGTNSSVWLDSEGDLQAGSRKRHLTLDFDNAGFFKAIKDDERIKAYLKENPTHTLYGEFLVPHSLKTYTQNARRKFYVFDVCTFDGDEVNYIHYDNYVQELEKHNIDYVPLIAKVVDGDNEKFYNLLEHNTFLIEDGKGIGEGIVIKNYLFVNKFGNKKFAKIVTNEFKTKHKKELGVPKTECNPIEKRIAEQFVTQSLVEKEKAKIEVEQGGWSSKNISMLLGKVWYSVITEESWNIVKDFKKPTIDYKLLQKYISNQTKAVCPNFF